MPLTLTIMEFPQLATNGFVLSPIVRERYPTHRSATSSRLRPTAVKILGGSSGVGLEAAKYLRAKGVVVESFSRSSGCNLRSFPVACEALRDAKDGVAVCLGAGRQRMTIEEEIQLYVSVISALRRVTNPGLAVLVVRSLVLSEVEQLLSSSIRGPWVILRPGAMIDRPECTGDDNLGFQENLVVTGDTRCNGLVSRRSVGRVVGDLLLGAVSIPDVNKQVLGVYDRKRMVSIPGDCKLFGSDLWHRPVQ